MRALERGGRSESSAPLFTRGRRDTPAGAGDAALRFGGTGWHGNGATATPALAGEDLKGTFPRRYDRLIRKVDRLNSLPPPGDTGDSQKKHPSLPNVRWCSR